MDVRFIAYNKNLNPDNNSDKHAPKFRPLHSSPAFEANVVEAYSETPSPRKMQPTLGTTDKSSDATGTDMASSTSAGPLQGTVQPLQ